MASKDPLLMPNGYNLLLSILLLVFCYLCFTEIAIEYNLLGRGRENSLFFSYSYYNQDTTSLLISASLGPFGLFFFTRFASKIREYPTWEYASASLFIAISFWIPALNNYSNPLFEFHPQYFIALGLSLITFIIIILLYFRITFSTKRKLNETLLDDHQTF